MKKTYLLNMVLISFLATACQKQPDPPAPQPPTGTTTNPNPPPPPPVTNCQGATIYWTLEGNPPINDLSSKSFTIPGFELSCGDSVRVFMRKPGVQEWTQFYDIDNGASYYSLLNQVVTVHNRTGIILQVDIEAILK